MGYWDGAVQGAKIGEQIGDNLTTGALAYQNAQMDTNEKARQLAVAAGMRNAAANAQPIAPVTTTTTDGGYTPAPPVDTSANARALLGAPADATPAKTRANEAIYGVVSPTTAPTAAPADLNYSPAPAFNPVADQQSAAADQAAQPVTTTTTTPGSPANPLKAQIEYLNSIGETQKAQALSDSLIDHANKVMTLTGNPNDALKIVNDATGEKLAYSPLASLDAITNDGQLVGYIDKNKYKELVTAGAQPMEAMKGAMIPLDLGGGGKAVMEYLSQHPNATDAELAGVGEKAGVPLSKMIPLLAERQKVQAQVEQNARQDKSIAASDARTDKTIAASDARQDKTIAAIAGRQDKTLANGRLYSVLDTHNGNRPIMITSEENAANPGRYLAAGAGAKALGQTNLQEDIKGTINNVKKSIGNLDADFTPAQAAQISVAMRSQDPHSAISNFYQSAIGKTLTPKQQEYIADLQQLSENAMAMRSVLGAGQGSDQMRAAIEATLPNATTPDRKTALMKLNKFEQTVDRLGRGIPKVELNPMPGAQTAPPVPGASKAPDGNWYLPDPKRPGKYLRVGA